MLDGQSAIELHPIAPADWQDFVVWLQVLPTGQSLLARHSLVEAMIHTFEVPHDMPEGQFAVVWQEGGGATQTEYVASQTNPLEQPAVDVQLEGGRTAQKPFVHCRSREHSPSPVQGAAVLGSQM